MGIFDFWKQRKIPIDFTEQNVLELKEKTDKLGNILIKNGLDFYVEYLSQILITAENKNEPEFRKLVISRELFGGAGALWEIHIGNTTEYRKFNDQFCDYLDLLYQMGIKDRALKQTRKIMPKLY
jgi:hypothetical protein